MEKTTAHTKSLTDPSDPSNMPDRSNEPKPCATGSCGGPGLCPGVALFLAYVLGGGVTLLTGLTWLGWTIGIPTALILLTGAWRFLPKGKNS